MNTGMPRRRASSRMRILMSRESHSSMTRSRPSRNASMLSSVDTAGEHVDSQIRIEFGHAAGHDDGFVDAEIAHRGRNPVQVRQLDAVQVGEPEAAAQALLGQRVGDGMADAEAHDADVQPTEPVLLGLGDLVAVAVQPELAVGEGRRHGDQRPPPRVPRPGGPGRAVGVGQRRADRGQLGPQILPPVEHGDVGTPTQPAQHGGVGRAGLVEHLGAVVAGVGGRRGRATPDEGEEATHHATDGSVVSTGTRPKRASDSLVRALYWSAVTSSAMRARSHQSSNVRYRSSG